jgi:methylglutaconyl-CoA hydratase
MSTGVLKVEEAGGILTLSLNRPEKRNALSGELVEALTRALEEARGREEVGVILLRGEGPDFCAGADLRELEGMLDQSPEAGLADARRLGALLLAMRRHPKPIVAVVQGRALAGGCGLATACDLILAREDAELGYPEVHLGFVPAMVMAILRRKLTEGRALELVALGSRISAREAYRIGLVNRVVPAVGFEDHVSAFAAELANRPPSALALTKGLLYEQADLTVAEGIERGAQVNVEARTTDACREGVRSFLDRKRGDSE